jgi:hypothetical protein
MQRIEIRNPMQKILPIALMLLGLAGILVAVGADRLGIGGPSGFGPNQISMAISGLVLIVAGAVMNTSLSYRNIGQWLLVVAGVVVVGLAADLLVFGGLPGMLFKQLMLGTVIFGIALNAVVASPAISRKTIGEWIGMIAAQKAEALQFLMIVLQLGMLVLVIRSFELENQAFYNNLMPLVFYGFLIHFFLPSRYRLPFFLLLSTIGIAGILGFQNSVWLFGLGLLLISITHLPLSFGLRAAILLLVGGALVLLRTEIVQSPIPAIIWPILGSMFMFRLIIYFYDLSHEKEFNIWRSLSYFFLLPNIVFPFFPLVDFATFRRTYYDKDRYRIYQTGVEWILRGVLHLIAYRFVNYYLILAPEEVNNATELARFAISNFLLYVRVSGDFHIIVGLLHLFGFNLPVTNLQYFLSAGFSDMWRRINIYWKDFMLKVFYNPSYVRLKKMGTTRAILLSTVVVFIMTWFLHAYQWFWLRGSFLLTPTDVLFWTLLAVLMITNIFYEMRKGRKRSLGEKSWNWGEIFRTTLTATGTFAIMCILWSLWTGVSIPTWLALWSIAGGSFQSLAVLLASLLGIAVVFFFAIMLEKLINQVKKVLASGDTIFRPGTVNGVLIGAVLLAGTPAIFTRLGGGVQAVIQDLKSARLSDRDAELLRRGYYEDLIGVNRFNPDLWEIYSKRPTDWPLLQDTVLMDLADDFTIFHMNPNQSIIFHGERFSTNEFGLRDKSYSLSPSPDTFRIAVLGPSFVMGSGVADDETFEWVLEERLNEEYAGKTYARYEILNFAVAGFSAMQELYYLDTKAVPFNLNAVFYVAHQLEEEVTVRNFGSRVLVGSDIPYDYLKDLVRRAGVQRGLTQEEIERQLQPFGKEMVAWTYQQVVATARENGMVPVWIYIPALELPSSPEVTAELMAMAEEAGFVTIDLSDVYAGQNEKEIIVAEWDKHPNAKGQQLIARGLYEALLKKSDEIPLGLEP